MISIVERLLPTDEIGRFQSSLAKYPPRAIRLRPSKLFDTTPMMTSQVPWFSRGRIVESSSIRPSQFLEYVTGDYYIQDAGSMLALALMDVQPGEVICDLCAAPGGKASSILESLSECDYEKSAGGWLLANESIRSRLPILEYALARTGHLRYATLNCDPAQVAEKFPATFDAVLVDAPCSGQALVARDKHDYSAFEQRHIDHSAARQRRILLEAVKLLKPGGRLVYSTCTFAVEENESQVDFLMNEFPGQLEPIRFEHLSNWQSSISPGCYRVWPHRDATAGAFAAGLRLVGEAVSTTRTTEPKYSGKHKRRKSSEPSNLSGEEGICLLGQYGLPTRLRAKSFGDRITAIADDVLIDDAIWLTRWPELLQKFGSRWEPQYALAIANNHYFNHFRLVELSDTEVKSYLMGQAISKAQDGNNLSADRNAASPTQSPWCIAAYNGKAIGWMKDAGNRFNNQLPKIAHQNLSIAQ